MDRGDNKEYFLSLTSLRGLAALWVAIGHISWTLPATSLVAAMPMIRHGYLAVDFFFILSGFILAHAYKLGAAASLADFFKFARARLARIFPVHVILLASFAIIYVAFRANGIHLPEAYAGAYDIRAFIAQFFLVHIAPIWNKNYFFVWNYPSWTLALEAWWFIAIGGGLTLFHVLARRLRPASRKLILVGVLAATAILMGIPMLRKSPAFINDPNFYNSLLRSGLEFLIGFLLYRAFTLKKFSLRKWQMWGIYLLMWVWLGLWFMPIPLYATISYSLALVVLIIIVALEKEGAIYAFLTRPHLVYLGNISYSLYLVHGPIERIIAAIYPRTSHSLLGIIFFYALFLASTIFLASLSYAFIEKPLLSYFKKNRRG